jgi:hypothetical protein
MAWMWCWTQTGSPTGEAADLITAKTGPCCSCRATNTITGENKGVYGVYKEVVYRPAVDIWET